jgi:DivIVA domain-containing protein
MALDRQSIEKRDFPIGRRGYEPEAVDAHLARIAEEVEELRRRAAGAPAGTAKSSPASLAQAASEQVRSIVEAAESSAAAIERGAHDEALRIRDEAEADARQTRDEAVAQSQEQVGNVRTATTQMLQRVDAMESELAGLVESLRTGANRLTADMSLLEGGMGDLYDAAGREPSTPTSAAAAPSSPRVVESMPMAVAPVEPAEGEAEAEERGPFAADEPESAEEVLVEEIVVVEAVSAPEPSDEDGDSEGARLVALNMALNGTSREETDRYLAENFDLADRAALLDEVYATVEP